MRRLLAAVAFLVSCTASPVVTGSPSPTATQSSPPLATASATATPAFRDLMVAAAGDVRGDHALALHVISSPTAGVPSQLRIWDVPIDGSPARQLVAYTRGPQIFTDFDNLVLSRQLSADGRRLVLSDPVDVSGSGLLVVDLIAGTARMIAIDGGSDQPAWSPDGQRIAYRGFTVAGPFQKESGVWTVPAAGGGAQQVWVSDRAAGSGASTIHGWSEDGSSVVLSQGSSASVIEVATGKITRVSGAVQAIASRAKRPAVAIVFDDSQPPSQARVGHVDVRDTILSTSSTVARYGPSEGTFFITTSWNPLSDELLLPYACGQGVNCRNELVIVDGVTASRRVLSTTTTPRSAAWTADGAHILYSDLGALRVINSDGSNDHMLFKPSGSTQQFVTAAVAFAPR
jgi:hypothetical protein